MTPFGKAGARVQEAGTFTSPHPTVIPSPPFTVFQPITRAPATRPRQGLVSRQRLRNGLGSMNEPPVQFCSARALLAVPKYSGYRWACLVPIGTATLVRATHSQAMRHLCPWRYHNNLFAASHRPLTNEQIRTVTPLRLRSSRGVSGALLRNVSRHLTNVADGSDLFAPPDNIGTVKMGSPKSHLLEMQQLVRSVVHNGTRAAVQPVNCARCPSYWFRPYFRPYFLAIERKGGVYSQIAGRWGIHNGR